MSGSDDHCFELVRSGDKDHFLASLFAPDDKRPHLLALYAFNLEVTRIASLVSEPQIGVIRQQWWRDTIEGIYQGNVVDHPVAGPLARAIEFGNLPKHALINLVTAHEFDLFADPVESLNQLEGYLGETSSALIQMAALILAAPEAQAASEAAGLAGVAYGLAQLLRHAERRALILPPGMDLNAAISHARKRLTEARALRPSVPVGALPAFLPVALTPIYLEKLQQGSGASFEVTQFRRQVILWWAARQDRF
jgi:15-cis-phytoene synthase